MPFPTIFTALFLSLYCSWADRSKFDFVSSLIALRSLSQRAPSLPKWRFAQERRAIKWFQRAMCPALKMENPIHQLKTYSQTNWSSALISLFNIEWTKWFFWWLPTSYMQCLHKYSVYCTPELGSFVPYKQLTGWSVLCESLSKSRICLNSSVVHLHSHLPTHNIPEMAIDT